MLRLMRERGAVRVVADQIGTPTAAAPLADLLWALAVRPGLTGVFHWTDAGVASWYDFAVAIAEDARVRGLLSSAIEITRSRPRITRHRHAGRAAACSTSAVLWRLSGMARITGAFRCVRYWMNYPMRSMLVTGGAGFIGSNSCTIGSTCIRVSAWWCSMR